MKTLSQLIRKCLLKKAIKKGRLVTLPSNLTYVGHLLCYCAQSHFLLTSIVFQRPFKYTEYLNPFTFYGINVWPCLSIALDFSVNTFKYFKPNFKAFLYTFNEVLLWKGAIITPLSYLITSFTFHCMMAIKRTMLFLISYSGVQLSSNCLQIEEALDFVEFHFTAESSAILSLNKGGWVG